VDFPPSVDKLILVKFVRRYLIELHHFCQQEGHMPTILGYKQLPGGFYAMAMEWVEPSILITESHLIASNKEHWSRQLKELVAKFHAKGLVHGDLQDANIICRDNDCWSTLTGVE